MENNDLYSIAEKQGIIIDILSMPKNKSVSVHIDDEYFVAIDEKAMENSAEERTHLAHELGHCVTGSFYNIYSPFDLRSKHEYRADKWAIKKLIPKDELIELLEKEYRIDEIAEYFNVTEQFIQKAYHLYFEMETV